MRREKLYSPGKAAELLGIHFNTIKKWIYAGKVRAIKTLGGQYRILESEIKRLLGLPAPKNQSVIYARVSSVDQKEDLARQREMLQEYARDHGYKIVATFEDVASGLNETRRGLKQVFDTIRAGAADIVVVAWKDWLFRFGFKYLENHARDLGARTGRKTPQEELVEDLLPL